MQANYS